jgi:hypothetical protein
MCLLRPALFKREIAQNMSSRYFHELSNNEIATLIKNKFRSRDVRKLFLRPDFCMNKFALHDRVYGCVLLTDLSENGYRKQVCPSYCRENGCQCASESKKYFRLRDLAENLRPKNYPNRHLIACC